MRLIALIDHHDLRRHFVTFKNGCDGPGQQLANHMAQYCDLPVKKLGAKPGSLGSYAGETLGIPIITVEMLAEDSDLDYESLWRKYGKMLLAAITFPNRPD